MSNYLLSKSDYNLTNKTRPRHSNHNINILSINQSLIKNMGKFMFHYHKNFLPKAFTKSFFPLLPKKSIVTQSNSNIVSLFCNSSISQQSVKFWGRK